MRHRKNKKRIDPRYFLDETVDRDQEVPAEEALVLQELAQMREVTLGGGTRSMETILPDDVVMTREPGKSARFEVGGDDPFGEDEPIVDPERTRQIQSYLPPWETGLGPGSDSEFFGRTGWEDHPNREQLGDLWYAEQAYLDALSRGETSTRRTPLPGRPHPRERKWNAFEIPDVVQSPRSRILHDKDWPAEEDLEESKQRFKALVLQELALLREGTIPFADVLKLAPNLPRGFAVILGKKFQNDPRGREALKKALSDGSWRELVR